MMARSFELPTRRPARWAPVLLLAMVAGCGRGPDHAEENTILLDDFGSLEVTSPAFEPGGSYPVDFTCDGSGVSPPVELKNAPRGTKSFALHVWHIPGPGDVKSYWVLYNIPPDVASLPRNVKGIGVEGLNDKNHAGYDPMCSKGPGKKTYHITVLALSTELDFRGKPATRAELLKSAIDATLARKTLSFSYDRH